jgi:hypothetical protein
MIVAVDNSLAAQMETRKYREFQRPQKQIINSGPYSNKR